jgi:Predicted membrane protein
MQFSKTRILVECALLIAMSTVLSLVKVYQLPLGGSITLLSMLPVCMISVRHGLKWGFASSFVYALIQIALDLGSLMSWGLTPVMWVGSLIFDYVIAFGILGLSGIFTKKGKTGVLLGVALALFLRFVSHVISGTIFFAVWMPEGWNNPFLYSIVYNGSFMLPEIIFTMTAAPLVVTALEKYRGSAKKA